MVLVLRPVRGRSTDSFRASVCPRFSCMYLSRLGALIAGGDEVWRYAVEGCTLIERFSCFQPGVSTDDARRPTRRWKSTIAGPPFESVSLSRVCPSPTMVDDPSAPWVVRAYSFMGDESISMSALATGLYNVSPSWWSPEMVLRRRRYSQSERRATITTNTSPPRVAPTITPVVLLLRRCM